MKTRADANSAEIMLASLAAVAAVWGRHDSGADITHHAAGAGGQLAAFGSSCPQNRRRPT